MRGFRRSSGAEHLVHAIELPELAGRRRLRAARIVVQGAPTAAAAPAPAAPRTEDQVVRGGGESALLTHGHRPEDGVPLRTVDVPRPAPPEGPSGARSDANSQARIELLERRLAKLSRVLDERTAQLQLRMERGAVDNGVASTFTEVQGLRGDSEEVHRKRELMSAIFDANRKLRERVGSGVSKAE
ncbi:MAG: hypothetical protein R3F49_19850 [Planctomycetota bacterium]